MDSGKSVGKEFERSHDLYWALLWPVVTAKWFFTCGVKTTLRMILYLIIGAVISVLVHPYIKEYPLVIVFLFLYFMGFAMNLVFSKFHSFLNLEGSDAWVYLSLYWILEPFSGVAFGVVLIQLLSR